MPSPHEKRKLLVCSTSKIVGGVTACPPGSPNQKVLREPIRRKANAYTVVFISSVHASNERLLKTGWPPFGHTDFCSFN